MKKVSVIIPAYNVENYIKRTLDSVINQTYENLEIIVVDDGSADNTGHIADEEAAKDHRIRVIHRENGGLSAARNTALALITGELVTNVDADDYIRKDMVEIMVSDIEETRADLVICGHREGPQDSFSENLTEFSSKEIKTYSDGEKFMLLFNERKNESIVFWGKLYRREILDNISFPEGKIHEDEYIVHYVLDRCEKVAYDPRILYHYYKRGGSITTDNFSIKRLDCVPALLDRIVFFEEKGDQELLKYEYIDFLKRFQYFYYGVRLNFPERREIYMDLFDKYKEVYEKAYDLITIKYRLRFAMFIHYPMLNYHIKRAFGAKSIKI